MKATLITSALFAVFFATPLLAQDRTIVNANSSEISDNLDLRAIASIFGEAENLQNFERQLNDPKIQISNLDLNNDNQVDYLRVIESVKRNTHLVIVQAVLGRDTYQDVATIEVEKDRHNRVQVQVVGDVYMYGDNYIYEPVYVHSPIIYSSFWVPNYRPYCSAWYWDYYPTYYFAWNPCPVFRYRNNISVYINFENRYNYTTTRRSHTALAMYNIRRANYCEREYPTRAFAYRNTSVRNRFELDQTRTIRTVPSRNEVAYTNGRNDAPRNNHSPIRESQTPRTNENVRSNNNPIRENNSPRANENVRSNNNPIRENDTPRANENVRSNNNPIRENNTPRANENVRSNNNPIRENNTPRANENVRSNTYPVRENSTPRANSEIRGNSERENSQPRNSERGGRR
jgi:hypothetical protein